MKKLIGVLVALCLLLSCGVLTGCGGSDEAEPIVIGAIGPLTGENQLWGQILCEAVEMTAEEFNEAGGLNGPDLAGRGENEQRGCVSHGKRPPCSPAGGVI